MYACMHVCMIYTYIYIYMYIHTGPTLDYLEPQKRGLQGWYVSVVCGLRGGLGVLSGASSCVRVPSMLASSTLPDGISVGILILVVKQGSHRTSKR